ncbi:MAG: MoaD/ThiS family protein [Antricoccus sp.]
MAITVRFFAAAHEAAAGKDSVQYEPGTLESVVDRCVIDFGEKMSDLMPACSFLLDGVSMNDREAQIPDGAIVDVLPPFSGG